MTARAVNLFLTLAGLATVVLLVVLGLDLAHAANRGPRWKRRLVGAGLLLLGTLGLAPANSGCVDEEMADRVKDIQAQEARVEYSRTQVQILTSRLDAIDNLLSKDDRVDQEVLKQAILGIQQDLRAVTGDRGQWEPPVDRPTGWGALCMRAYELMAKVHERMGGQTGPSLTESAEWKHLVKTWQAAEETATGQRGIYPYTQAEKKQLLIDLAKAHDDLSELAQDRVLHPAEAVLLKADLEAFEKVARGFRTKEDSVEYACYLIGHPQAHPYSAPMEDRMLLLDRLVGSGRVRPEVMERVIASVEYDLADAPYDDFPFLKTRDGEALARVRDRAIARLRSIRSKMEPCHAPLTENKAWHHVMAVWKEAQSHDKTANETIDAAQTFSNKLGRTRTFLVRLLIEGQITESELYLLSQHVQRVGEQMYRDPEDPELVMPMQRLNDAIPALRRLPQDTTRNPLVIEIIFKDIGDEIQLFADPKHLQALKESFLYDGWAYAQKEKTILDDARAALQEAKRLLAAPQTDSAQKVRP